MGPAAWAAVARAIIVAIGAGLLGRDGLVRVVAEEVAAAIERHEFDLARTMIRNMQREHRAAYEAFIAKYGCGVRAD
jgi:Ni,Fe-hydrogenase maturation factor